MPQPSADTIERAAPADFDELIEMLDEVFGEHRPHDFRTLLPSIYRPTAEHTRWNLMIRREGKIAAVVGVFPIDWRVGDATLRIAGIGGVSTRTAYRGQGLMQKLMAQAVQCIHEEGYDLSFLAGQRQRYRYFGWERAGTAYRMHVNGHNLRHEASELATERLTLKDMGDDGSLLEQARKLHESQLMYCLRERAPFVDYVRQHRCRPWAVCDGQGRMIAYLVGKAEPGKLPELVGRDVPAAMAAVRLWVEKTGEADFIMSGLPTPFARRLSQVCERTSMESAGMWQIFNWAAVIDALLKVRHRMAPLAGGEVVIQIVNRDERVQAVTLRLYVMNSSGGCEATSSRPDLTLTAADATRLLFGPARPGLVMDLPSGARVLEAWCPLALGICETDYV